MIVFNTLHSWHPHAITLFNFADHCDDFVESFHTQRTAAHIFRSGQSASSFSSFLNEVTYLYIAQSRQQVAYLCWQISLIHTLQGIKSTLPASCQYGTLVGSRQFELRLADGLHTGHQFMVRRAECYFTCILHFGRTGRPCHIPSNQCKLNDSTYLNVLRQYLSIFSFSIW